ncbi:MAG: RNA ligase (ATP) [Thermomicrobia bacterium]|nr:RNA ligase (ATP) [Thermomicrobia bacterium]
MSSFAVTVHRLLVEEHPNADRLAIGSIAGQEYRFIVGKDRCEGELGAYIPEGSLLPDELIEEMGIRPYLAGPEKNRVKATRLRGVLSQGLWYPLPEPTGEMVGDDLTAHLGITKWEPPVPQQLQGIARARPIGATRDFWCDYDMENIKHYPDLFAAGEEVSLTEKLHGTLLFAAVIDGEDVVTSKGLAHRNLVIEPSESNTYWHVACELGLHDILHRYIDCHFDIKNAILFGEIIGVQDLKYGLANGKTHFYAFDLYTDSGFCDPEEFAAFCETWGVPMVPVLYEGPFDRAVVDELTGGRSTLAAHLREGVVIKPAKERYDARVGRVILKSISPDYLVRKGDVTEFN